MRTATVGTLFALALVLTAGCSQPLADESTSGETPTVTPVPVPDDATRSGTELAPGVERDGVVDPARLLRAHADVLSNESYTVRLSSRRADADQSVLFSYDRVLRVDEDGHFHYVLTTETPTVERRVERWRGAATAAEAVTENGTTAYRRLDDPSTPTLLTSGDLQRLFVTIPADVEAAGDRDGAAVHRVTGGPADMPPLSNVTYEAEVTERGLVRSYEITYDLVGRNPGMTVTVTATVSDVGETTVERPSWVDDAT